LADFGVYSTGTGRMSKSKRVAVIAIHGIAEQKPNDSAKEISSLLTRILPEKPESHYEFKKCADIEIPVEEPFREKDEQSDNFFDFDERGKKFKQEIKKLEKDKIDNEEIKEADYIFIKDQIYKYKVRGIHNIFRTKKVSLDYKLAKNNQLSGIDIYEMYWADLSRLGEGVISIIGNFYQLLFHLTSLGRQCLDYARYNYLKSISKSRKPCQCFCYSSLSLYSHIQAITARLLTLVIPILNIFILISSLSCLHTRIQGYATPLSMLIMELTSYVLFLIIIYLLYCIFKPKFIKPFIFLFMCGIFIVFGHHFLPESFIHINPLLQKEIKLNEHIISRLSSSILIFVSLLIVWRVYIVPYDRHRKGVAAAFVILSLAFLVLVLVTYFHWPKDLTSQPLTLSSLWIMEILYISLLLVWGLLLFFYAISFIMGYFISFIMGINIILNHSISEKKKQIYQIYRTTWTARVSLSLPITLFSLLTPSLWIVIAYAGGILWPPIDYPSLLFNPKSLPPSNFALALAILPGSGIRFEFFVLVLILIVSLVFAFFRSQLYEDGQILYKNKDKTGKSENLGGWLNIGFGVIVLGVELFLNFFIPLVLIEKFFGVFHKYILPIFLRLTHHFYPYIYALLFQDNFYLSPVQKFDISLIPSSQILAIFSSGLIVASLITFQKYLWGFLDLILDVDNYLRSRPIDDTPTGRIFARYSSLLREICKKAEDGKNKYDAIVIIAHSQGTVITADLLRFLAKEDNLESQKLENLKKLPIYLFTMGSPLRQLYNFGFPTLYHWVEDTESKLQNDQKAPICQFKELPENLLSVKKWVNAYRSGDYVGRYIWRSSTASDLWTPVKLTASKPDIRREEFCIGVGAHNHYWDEHAPQIAEKLNELIQESIQDQNNSQITS
jgi:hypothetical protein